MTISKNKRIYSLICIFVIFGTLVSGCITSGDNVDESPEPEKYIDIVDMQGRTITIPDTIERFVAIEAGALRYAVYCGGSSKIVGIEEIEFPDDTGAVSPKPYSYAHPEFSSLPSIGPIHGGDSELIATVEPDVIFWTYCTAEDANALQDQTGIPVIAIVYGNITDQWDTMKDALRLYGKVLDTENRVEELISYIESLVNDLNSRTADIDENDHPSVYVGGVAHRGPHSIDSTTPMYEPFIFLNANNVAAYLEGGSQIIDKEKLLDWDPDYIFLDESSYNINVWGDINSGLYDNMTAIQNQDIYGVMPYNWYTANWATIFVDAYYIGTVIYPEEFSDIDIEQKADEIYEMFVGAPVYSDMLSYYEGLMHLSHHLE